MKDISYCFGLTFCKSVQQGIMGQDFRVAGVYINEQQSLTKTLNVRSHAANTCIVSVSKSNKMKVNTTNANIDKPII